MNATKTSMTLALGLALFSASLPAAPFNETRVSNDARWVAHIDMEAFAGSTLGQFAIAQAKTAIERSNNSKISIDLDLVLAEVKSITASGTEFENEPDKNSVLVIEAGEKLQHIIDGLIAGMEASEDGETPFAHLEGRKFPAYLIGEEVYLAYPSKKLLMISKSFEKIEQCYAVYQGKSPNLRDAANPLILNNESGFFLIASATGFSKLKNVPHQARILQKTTGGQLSLGEAGDQVRANLILGASNGEVANQLFRIVQGMVALASFATVENEGLANLTQLMKVSQGERSVTVDVRYPIGEILKLAQLAMSEHERDDHRQGDHGDHEDDEEEFDD